MRKIQGYQVMRCAECGTLNVVHGKSIEGCICCDEESFIYGIQCAKCSGGLVEVGEAILQEEITSDITIEVNVQRQELDRLIEDVAAVHAEMNEISEKMKTIRGVRVVY